MKPFSQYSSSSNPINDHEDNLNQNLSNDLLLKNQSQNQPLLAHPPKYKRQQSIIDSLTQNKIRDNSSSMLLQNIITDIQSQDIIIMNKQPSIQLLLHEQDKYKKSQNPLVRKIQDIFVNKATLSSKQINSSMLLNNINQPLFVPKKPIDIISYLNKSPNKNNKNNVVNTQDIFQISPDKSNSKPFLRKKSSEKMSQNPQLSAMHKQNSNRQNQSKFDIKNINTSISNIQNYNRKLQCVLENIQEIRKSGRLDNEMEFNLNNQTDIQLLKFMVEKAIIRKDQHLS